MQLLKPGPYVYIKRFNKWYDLSQGVSPNQVYWDVEYLREENLVRFATYGRGIWEFKIEQLTSIAEPEKSLAFKISPNPAENQLSIDLGRTKRQGTYYQLCRSFYKVH